MKECEDLVNKTLYDGVSAISALIMKNGSINIDFAENLSLGRRRPFQGFLRLRERARVEDAGRNAEAL